MYEHRPKKVRMYSSKFGSPNKVSLSDLAFGELDYGLGVENSFVNIHEQREINYWKYMQLMKTSIFKAKIREGEPEDKPKQKIKK